MRPQRRTPCNRGVIRTWCNQNVVRIRDQFTRFLGNQISSVLK